MRYATVEPSQRQRGDLRNDVVLRITLANIAFPLHFLH